MEQYVLVRIIRMDGVDIGLFDYDLHNTLYYFALNAEEQIYLRYGGRTAESPTSHLDLESLELALEQGLELHRRYREGRFEPPARPAAFFPGEIESLRTKEMNRGRCVECHLVADYEAQDLQSAGVLDKVRTMFKSPDLERIGVELDVPKGLVVGRADGPAAHAGLLAGDRIVAVEGDPVLTFGDLQYRYDQLARTSEKLALGVERQGARIDLEIRLPLEWWATDLFFRYWSVEPVLYFSADRLEVVQAQELGLDAEGFACRVRFVERRAAIFGNHALEPGDVIYAVDGVERSSLTTSCELHLKLATVAGEESQLGVVREGKRVQMPFRSGTQRFRK